jgi:predicted dehydrogenase
MTAEKHIFTEKPVAWNLRQIVEIAKKVADYDKIVQVGYHHFPSPVIIQGYQGELAWEKKVIVSYEEAFYNELRAFYENIQHNKQPKTTVSDALKHTRFISQVIDILTG